MSAGHLHAVGHRLTDQRDRSLVATHRGALGPPKPGPDGGRRAHGLGRHAVRQPDYLQVLVQFGYVLLMAPAPRTSVLLFFIVERALRRLPTRLVQDNDCGDWVPFVGAVGIVMPAFHGLAYSPFPLAGGRSADDLAGRQQQ